MWRQWKSKENRSKGEELGVLKLVTFRKTCTVECQKEDLMAFLSPWYVVFSKIIPRQKNRTETDTGSGEKNSQTEVPLFFGMILVLMFGVTELLSHIVA